MVNYRVVWCGVYRWRRIGVLFHIGAVTQAPVQTPFHSAAHVLRLPDPVRSDRTAYANRLSLYVKIEQCVS